MLTTTPSCDNPVYDPDDPFTPVITEDKVFLLNFEEITDEQYGFCRTVAPGYMYTEDVFHCSWTLYETDYAIVQNERRVTRYWLRTRGETSARNMKLCVYGLVYGCSMYTEI